LRYRFRLDRGGQGTSRTGVESSTEGTHETFGKIVDPEDFTSLGPPVRGAGGRARARSSTEMHVGTFTPDGSWEAASSVNSRFSPSSVITCLEIMPGAEFPGRFGGDYDAQLFAPTRLYGRRRNRRFSRSWNAPMLLGIRRDPRRRLQPFRPDGNDLNLFSGLISRSLRQRMG